MADYMAWYNPTTFDGAQTFDLPAAGPYYSSDLSTVKRQLAEAKQACLDGFSVHWYGPFDPVTTGNFTDAWLYMIAPLVGAVGAVPI